MGTAVASIGPDVLRLLDGAGILAVHGRLLARLLVAAVEHSLMVHIAGWADNVGTGWGVDDAKARNHRCLLARYSRAGAADLGTS